MGEPRHLAIGIRLGVMRPNVITSELLAMLRACAAADVQRDDVQAGCAQIGIRLHRSPMAVRLHVGRAWGAGLLEPRSLRLTDLGWLAVNGAQVAA